jgi:hypothetical protein
MTEGTISDVEHRGLPTYGLGALPVVESSSIINNKIHI